MCQKTYVCLNEIQDVNVNVFMGNKYPIEILKREKIKCMIFTFWF